MNARELIGASLCGWPPYPDPTFPEEFTQERRPSRSLHSHMLALLDECSYNTVSVIPKRCGSATTMAMCVLCNKTTLPSGATKYPSFTSGPNLP